jgi:hypothetical protein
MISTITVKSLRLPRVLYLQRQVTTLKTEHSASTLATLQTLLFQKKQQRITFQKTITTITTPTS